uniref:SPIN-DOC-like zinc-finger domain-containing protein n=1 Tax=Octopus bimaculoides TaxID=37653 RepID=A0A0L8FG52_OCTBM
MSSSKKRKVDNESQVFQEKWTNDYFFMQIKNKPVCLLCSESVSVIEEYNVNRHYISKHSSHYESFYGQRRKQKVENLIKDLKEWQTIFVKRHEDTENIIHASYIISEKIAKHLKNYSDDEFVKECLQAVAEIFCSGQKKEIDNFSLSLRTVTRWIDELATNAELGLKRLSLHFEYFSLAIDKSTDVSNIAQLVVFVCGIDEDLNITEEMLGLRGMKDTTTGEDIFEELKMLMARFNLHFKNLDGLSTDGAPAMVGSKADLVSKIRSELASMSIDTKDLSIFHCIIHQENLCAKSLKFEHVMSKVVSSINFIKHQALNHCQFKEFLEDIEAEYGDLVYYCEMEWSEIFTVMEIKGKSMCELSDDGWICDLAFLVDFISYLNGLYLKFINQASEELQMELIELQGNEDLQQGNERENFPFIVDFATKKMSLFGITYKCEQLFSKLKSTKSKARSRITDNHLENNLRVATSSISSNIKMLVKKHQPQISH